MVRKIRALYEAVGFDFSDLDNVFDKKKPLWIDACWFLSFITYMALFGLGLVLIIIYGGSHHKEGGDAAVLLILPLLGVTVFAFMPVTLGLAMILASPIVLAKTIYRKIRTA